MYYLPICHLLLYLSIWLACQPYPTDASLSIIDDKGNNNTYITEDYFLLSQPHYRYEGYLMYWTFSNSSTAPNCTVNTVNKSSRYIQETVAIASNYTNLAIIMNDKDFTNAGCTTKEQAKTAVEDLMSQLEQAEFPPVQLLIISSFAMYVQWEFDYLTYQPDVLFKELATWPRIKFTYTISDDNQLVNNMLYYKHAEHPYVLDSDPGSTNKVYMSTGFLACKWIYFIVLLGMLSYSVVRALVLVRLRKLKLNLLLVAFIITIVYCIFLLTHLVNMIDSFKYQSTVRSFLSKFLFSIILFHWSLVGRKLFSRASLLCFQGLITLDLGTNIYLLVSYLLTYARAGGASLSGVIQLYKTTRYCLTAASFICITIFAGFTIWFGINTYKLRRHREGRFRFMQLACFSALGCLTYIIFTVYFLYNLNAREPLDTSYFAKVELVYNMAYLIRALVFLAAFGVHWPLSKAESNKRRTPIEETTIGEHKTMVDEENPLHRQLTRKFTMLTERYMPSTAKQ